MAHRTSDEADYPWLSEFLCEYVDGTMDPAARAMFEECLRGNPDLVAHVERLRVARQMLCAYGCRRLPAPCNLHDALHQRIAFEQRDVPAAQHILPTRLSAMTLVFAALLVVMASSLALPPDPSEAVAVERMPYRTEATIAPTLYQDRPPVVPDTLPRSVALLRIRATLPMGTFAP